MSRKTGDRGAGHGSPPGSRKRALFSRPPKKGHDDDRPSLGLVTDDSITEATIDEHLIQRYQDLEETRRRLDLEQALLVAELHRRRTSDRHFGHRTKAWIAAQSGAPGRHAAREMRIASLLTDCDVLAEALHKGNISVHHVDTIARNTNDRNRDIVIAIQQQLIDLIDTYTRFERWEAQVRDLLAIADQDGGHDPRPEDNRMSLNRGLNGELNVRGTFVGRWALTVEEILNDLANRELRRFRNDNKQTKGETDIPSRANLMALAFAEACREATAATGSKSRGPAAEVSLVIRSENPLETRTVNDFKIDDASADVFKCDPVIHPIIVDSLGVPIDLGRTVRYATAAQRRALAVRDGGCVFPGCDAPHAWTDAHHVLYWDFLGPTDLINLASLCRHHHGVIHRTGWDMRPDGTGRFLIKTPSGLILITQQHGKLPDPDPTPQWDPTGPTNSGPSLPGLAVV